MSRSKCPHCGVPDASPMPPDIWGCCPKCESLLFPSTGEPSVIIVHESNEMAIEIGTVLHSHGMAPLRLADGAGTLALLVAQNAAALVVDVGLCNPTAFQVIDAVRNDSRFRTKKIVLVASVFNKTAYKCRPKSLYGADDYVEQHHVGDKLPRKLRTLMGRSDDENGEAPKSARPRVDATEVSQGAEEEGERNKRLAKRLVADVAMYCQEDMEKAIDGGATERLREALAEARTMYASAVDKANYPSLDPVGDAYNELLASMESLRK